MKNKKLLIGIAVSTIASLGLWLGLGSSASAQPVKARPAQVAVAHDGDTARSGERTSPDAGSTDGTETDGVDCQQDGNFDGVNAAGTGVGCTGSGT